MPAYYNKAEIKHFHVASSQCLPENYIAANSFFKMNIFLKLMHNRYSHIFILPKILSFCLGKQCEGNLTDVGSCSQSLHVGFYLFDRKL